MIEIKHVDKVYLNGFKALSDVNLTIQDGEFVSIIGLSGAGKSTLIRCINRMHDISGGEILIDGVDISSLKGKKNKVKDGEVELIAGVALKNTRAAGVLRGVQIKAA